MFSYFIAIVFFWHNFKSECNVCRNVTGQKVTNAQTLTGLSGQFRSGEKSYFVIHGWNDGGTDSVRGWELNLTGTLLAKVGANSPSV